ncbi:type II secretion system protein GspL [Pseudidiomarina insulisalsae]|uniref:Type II secretion system protein L n=1 Tax=Pseudidiomarina insulisalsae TaxID=575789 RepID=A0A432YNV6_9GAMM|nr:type II secretion system protein GspL [Pseudidiomarina insulisalsae]RUO62588.1 type II secretion system protein GspL [Pseudidiomarina insulisalsae]
MEQLYIHLAQPVRWLIWHPGQGEVIASGELSDSGQLHQLSEKAQRCTVTVLVPGQDVLLTEVRLPAGSQRLLPQLVPNTLEDELASDIDSLHFAWPANARPGGVDVPIPVTVVAKERMREWLDALQSANLEVDAMYPDYFALPVVEGGAQLRLGHSLLVREGEWQAYSTDYPPLLTSDAQDITDQFEMPLQVASAAHVQNGINLRQGDYRPVRKRRKQNLQLPWRPAAIAAAIALLALFGQQLTTYLQLGEENEQLQAAIETTFREAFPQTTRIVNVRSQLRQQLAGLGMSNSAGADLATGGVSMLGELEPAFASTPDLQLEYIRYNNATLQLQVNARDFDSLQRFQEAATQTGLSVNQGQVTNQNGAVTGTIEVRKES